MKSVKPYRRSPRLKEYGYLGPLAAHLVLVTRRREPFFLQTELAQIVLMELVTISTKFNATVHAYWEET